MCKELLTCTTVKFTSDLQHDTEEINNKYLTPKKYDDLVLQT